MGLPFFVNCSFLIQRVIYFETAPFYLSINVQNYFQLISSYKIPMQKEKTLTQILV